MKGLQGFGRICVYSGDVWAWGGGRSGDAALRIPMQVDEGRACVGGMYRFPQVEAGARDQGWPALTCLFTTNSHVQTEQDSSLVLETIVTKKGCYRGWIFNRHALIFPPCPRLLLSLPSYCWSQVSSTDERPEWGQAAHLAGGSGSVFPRGLSTSRSQGS